jgi:hypothetical protein
MKTTTIAIVMTACAAMCTSAAWAQSTRPPLVGGYVSAGAGLARPPASNPTSVATETDGLNTDQATTTFELPGARTFEFGGGVTFLGALTVGAAFEDSVSDQAGRVDLSLTHPLFHPVLRTSKTAGPLQHSEKATHIEIGYRFPRTGPFAIRVFGGPTHVSLRQDAVSMLGYDETFDPVTRTFTASITDLKTEPVKALAWGRRPAALQPRHGRSREPAAVAGGRPHDDRSVQGGWRARHRRRAGSLLAVGAD